MRSSRKHGERTRYGDHGPSRDDGARREAGAGRGAEERQRGEPCRTLSPRAALVVPRMQAHLRGEDALSVGPLQAVGLGVDGVRRVHGRRAPPARDREEGRDVPLHRLVHEDALLRGHGAQAAALVGRVLQDRRHLPARVPAGRSLARQVVRAGGTALGTRLERGRTCCAGRVSGVAASAWAVDGVEESASVMVVQSTGYGGQGA